MVSQKVGSSVNRSDVIKHKTLSLRSERKMTTIEEAELTNIKLHSRANVSN